MEEEVKNRYVLGVIGALVGALVGAVPWILMYIFANMMYAILAILIVLGSFYGYKLTKAKIDKKLPVILSITSFISITVTMFVIIPMAYLVQEGHGFSFELLTSLYQYDEFTKAIMTDYVISLLFCFIVIGGIIINLNKQIREGVDSKDIKLISQNASNSVFSNEDIDNVRSIFEKNDAMDKHHTITKDLIMEDIVRQFGDEKGKQIFNYLKVQKIIRKKSGKYYFSEKAQNSTFYRYGLTSIKTFFIILIIAIVVACIIIFVGEKSNDNLDLLQSNTLTDTTRVNTYEAGVDNIKLEFPSNIVMLTKDEIIYYFGEVYANAYDCLAMSPDFSKMVMVFTDNKSNYEEEYTPEEYLKMSLQDENVEVEKQEVSGHTFYVHVKTYEGENGSTYVEQDYIYDAGDSFICLVFDSLESDKINVGEIIK